MKYLTRTLSALKPDGSSDDRPYSCYLEVDDEAILMRLARKAIRSKGRRATALGGRVKVIVTRID